MIEESNYGDAYSLDIEASKAAVEKYGEFIDEYEKKEQAEGETGSGIYTYCAFYGHLWWDDAVLWGRMNRSIPPRRRRSGTGRANHHPACTRMRF